MRKKHLSFLGILLIVIMMISTTGCGVRIMGKDYNFFTISKEDKNNVFEGIGSQQEGNEVISDEKLDANEIVIENSVGDIDIKNAEDNKIHVDIIKKVRGANTEDKNTILENININIDRTSPKLKVTLKAKDGEDFWKWHEKNYKRYNVSVDFQISLPTGFKSISINSGVGDVDIEKLEAALGIKLGVGDISIENTTIINKNDLTTGTGNIDFSGQFKDVTAFMATTGVGEIELEVPEKSNFSIAAKTGVGDISGSFVENIGNDRSHYSADINGGGASVKLDTGVGSISIDKIN